MKIENAQYKKNDMTNENGSITATIDGVVWSVPLSENNRHYAEILKQVKEGTLTIQDAD